MFNLKLKRKYPMVISLITTGIILAGYLLGIAINVTPSMQEGIYIKTGGKILTGDIISFCLDEPYKTLGLKRLYLGIGHKCNGANPLIKKIIAIPGDDVVLTDQYIKVNSIKYFYKTLYVDNVGRKLDVYPRGNHPKTKGYWVIGTHTANSWDSRYWGPISQNEILCKLSPLLTW
jgi:conjugative transfer signal peptidase TraF